MTTLKRTQPFARIDRQRGTTLIVAILLLLVMTIITLLAANVGVFEQRTSTNDLRSKMMTQVAQAALGEGAEFMKLRSSQVVPKPTKGVNSTPFCDTALGGTTCWQNCGSAETSFPCGAEPDATRRAKLYKWVGGIDLDGSGGAPDAVETNMLPFALIKKSTGSTDRQNIVNIPGANATTFPVSYGVGALLCRYAPTDPSGTGCTTTDSLTSDKSSITLVARAKMTGESAAVTLTQQVATFRIFNIPPNTPPVVTTGLLSGIGSATVVANPNSGGFGVPISLWSRVNMDSNNGSWQTCHLGEYYATGTLTTEVDPDDASVTGTYCDNCDCDADTAISKGPGNGGGWRESYDILDVDSNVGELPDSTYFPCDLFQFAFGFKARRVSSTPGVCDTLIDSDGDGTPDVVQNYLRPFFREISCSDLGTSVTQNGGKFWVTSGFSGGRCTLPASAVGTVTRPVIAVVDADVKFANGTRFFGFLFARDTRPVSSSTGGPGLDPGGGNGKLFGAVVLEGGAVANGNIDIVFNGDVINNLNNSPSNNPFAPVPGSFTDRSSY